MTRAIRSEFLKFFSTRMWWGMAIATLLAGSAFAMLYGFLVAGSPTGPGTARHAPGLGDPAMVRAIYTGGLSVGYLLTLSIGVLMIGSEYRHKTITSTFLSTPKRVTVMLAKVVALLVIGALYGVISLIGSVGTGAAIIAGKGYAPFPDSSIWRVLALSLLVLGLWALIGLGAGILIPNQVAALLISVGVAWIVEPILGAVVASQSWGANVAPYFPTNATTAVLSVDSSAFGGSSSYTPLSWWAAALVLTGYAAIMALIGSALTVRRDIS